MVGLRWLLGKLRLLQVLDLSLLAGDTVESGDILGLQDGGGAARAVGNEETRCSLRRIADFLHREGSPRFPYYKDCRITFRMAVIHV